MKKLIKKVVTKKSIIAIVIVVCILVLSFIVLGRVAKQAPKVAPVAPVVVAPVK